MTHADIINLWPSLGEFAADLSVPYGTAKQMRRRGSIPPSHWSAVVSGAERRGIADVTLDKLTEAKKRPAPSEARGLI